MKDEEVREYLKYLTDDQIEAAYEAIREIKDKIRYEVLSIVYNFNAIIRL